MSLTAENRLGISPRMRESHPGIFVGFLLMIAVGTGPSGAQASCNYGQDLDLRAVYPEIFRSLPVMDQGTVGVCYAHAAATLVDFYRLKLKSEQAGMQSVNPIDAAQVGTLEAQDGDVEGGQICDVVNGLSKRGFGYVSTSISATQFRDLGVQTQIQAVKRVFTDYIGEGNKNFASVRVDPQFFSPSKRKKLSPAQKAYLARFDGLISWIRSEISSRGIQTRATDAGIFGFIQDNHARNDYSNFPVKFEMFIAGDSNQRASFRIPSLSCKHERGGMDGSAYISDIDRALDYQKVPVGIDLCANVLTQKAYRGYAAYGKLKTDCKPHAVLVIGKRLGRAGCEYLIRNSWGYSYSGYAWPADSGDVWIGETAFFGNVYGTSVVRF
jgi:hypothetical protein